VLLFKIKHSKEWLNYKHCINAKDTIVTILIDIVDEISILIIIILSSFITSHAEIRFLIMKFWVFTTNDNEILDTSTFLKNRKLKTKFRKSKSQIQILRRNLCTIHNNFSYEDM
jgi:hypothetical protein